MEIKAFAVNSLSFLVKRTITTLEDNIIVESTDFQAELTLFI